MDVETQTAYQVSFELSPRRVKVEFAGETLADSRRTMTLRETRLPPTYYFPRADVRMDLLERTDFHTHCPFKGNASYWSIDVGGRGAENAAWSYEAPFEEATVVKDFIAFDWDAMDAWLEDGVPVLARDVTGVGSRNPYTDWLFNEAWKAQTAAELVADLSRQLVDHELPLLRFGLFIRTLHPLMFAWGFNWWRTRDGVYEYQTPHETLLKSEYLDSPYAPILNGVGGVRRRLEGANAELDFPILQDLRKQGATDYVAMPLLFSDGQINIVTLVSDRPGGFTTGGLGDVYEILPLLANLFEIHALRRKLEVLLDTYLGKHTGPKVLEGQIKRGDHEIIHAVIWYSDLRDSTRLAESLPRDDYLKLLNDFFDCIAGIVLEHGGEVLKFIGDGVMAIFPIEDPDHATPAAARVALTAVRLARERIAEVNAGRAARREPEIGFGIALHRGDVTYGNIGTSGRLDFTVVGPAVNEAARIEGLTKTLGAPILVSASLARSLPGELVSLGRHALRGVEHDVELFTLRD